MKIMMGLVALAMLTIGCTGVFKGSERSPALAKKLDPNRGVVVSVPEDSWHGGMQNKNSGRMTAQAITSAFSQHAVLVKMVDTCHGYGCLDRMDPVKYGYYVQPHIIKWEESALEWTGKPDKIEIQIVIYDTTNNKVISDSSFSDKSNWVNFGDNNTQSLLLEPSKAHISALYP